MELNKHTVRLFAVVVFLLDVAAHAQTGATAQPKNAASETTQSPANPDMNGQTPPPSNPGNISQGGLESQRHT